MTRLIPFLVVFLISCSTVIPTPPPTPSPVPTATPLPLATARPTDTPRPTATSAPSGAPTATAVPGATATRAPQANPTLDLVPVVMGLSQPLFITHAGDGSGEIYVVEKAGRVEVAKDGVKRTVPFLNITDRVRSSGSEQGLLGLAFHPNYKTNGWFYVNYTDLNGDTVIARYTASGDRRVADANSQKQILFVAQPYANHNGGNLIFGPDGMLWIGLGDGGSAGDPQRNGQNKAALLGKMLRIDVDRGDPYAIPRDNPFVNDPGARGEVWAFGLRNPWRYSFDRATGDLYIADVGQNAWEEIDFVAAGTRGGMNFGWNRMEGAHCYPPSVTNCDPGGVTLPVAEYRNPQEGCSVTGGYVYRGKQFPGLSGIYFFSDYCNPTLWSLKRSSDGTWTRTEAIPRVSGSPGFSSFGEDEAGELYLTGLNNGIIYQLVGK